MINELNFENICKKFSEKFNSETLKLQPVNLSETSRDTTGVHQRAAGSLQKFLMLLPFVTTRPLECFDRLINGLFHSRCLDVQADEKIIILKLALCEQDEYKDKTNFFSK